jgi:NAD(P)H-hydrate repair Nnr-like enzyme with NAD(P)H-hydrate dehydratase domain
LSAAIGQGLPTVVDAGALDLLSAATGPVVITPHFRELARVLGEDAGDLAENPGEAAARAAGQLGVTVLLKGHNSYIAAPDGTRLVASSAPAWTATAGTGDALGGILGALLATHAKDLTGGSSAEDGALLAKLAATASVIHGLAADRASGGGPFVVLELAEAIPAIIAGLLGAGLLGAGQLGAGQLGGQVPDSH